LWDNLSEQIHGFLSGISLADLVAKRDVQDVAERQVARVLLIDDKVQVSTY
jgi:Rrf2 family iron-sulfur cluster assembly transcriptional regulator